MMLYPFREILLNWVISVYKHFVRKKSRGGEKKNFVFLCVFPFSVFIFGLETRCRNTQEF